MFCHYTKWICFRNQLWGPSSSWNPQYPAIRFILPIFIVYPPRFPLHLPSFVERWKSPCPSQQHNESSCVAKDIFSYVQRGFKRICLTKQSNSDQLSQDVDTDTILSFYEIILSIVSCVLFSVYFSCYCPSCLWSYFLWHFPSSFHFFHHIFCLISILFSIYFRLWSI